MGGNRQRPWPPRRVSRDHLRRGHAHSGDQCDSDRVPGRNVRSGAEWRQRPRSRHAPDEWNGARDPVEITTGDGDDTEDDTEDNDDDSDGNPHHGEGSHDGTVSSFRGACPTVTFNLKGLTIVADGATTYFGGTCATLRPSVKVVVTGALSAARRTFKAATITITRAH